MSQNRIVLLGMTGCGKSFLYNRITNSNEKVLQGGRNQQLTVFKKKSAFGNEPFEVLDPPGLNNNPFKIKTTALIVAALTAEPVRRVIIIVKYSNLNQMVQEIKTVKAIVSRFRYLITILVTHWDLVSTNIQDQKKMVEENLSRYHMNSIIFSTKMDNGEILSIKISQELQKSPAEKILFKPGEIESSFDLLEISDESAELELNMIKTEVCQRFRPIARAISQFIQNSLPNQPFFLDLLHLITLEIKQKGKECVIQTEKSYLDLFYQSFYNQEEQASVLHYELKNGLKPDIECLCLLAQKKMQKCQDHFSHKMKACPFCDQIWMVEDQINDMFCGNYKPKFYLKWENNEIKPIAIQQIQQQHDEIGCGKKITYNQMLDLTNEQKYELANPGILDFMANDGEIEAVLQKSKKKLNEILNLEIIEKVKLLQQ